MERIAETHHVLELDIFKELHNSLILLFLITVFVNWLVEVKNVWKHKLCENRSGKEILVSNRVEVIRAPLIMFETSVTYNGGKQLFLTKILFKLCSQSCL